MAIMIPSVISPEVKSTAEKRIFEFFKNAPGTDKWIVLHSLGIANHNKVLYGEIDFLVLAPNLGLFALEVKGGRVKREQGKWYFTDKYGKTSSKIRGPFEQAKDGIFSVFNGLEKKVGPDYKHIPKLLFGYGVMFPDIEYNCMSVDEEQWQVFDSRDGKDVKSFIYRLSAGVKENWNRLYGPMKESKIPTLQDIKYVSNILRGDFDYAISLSKQLMQAKEELISLTAEQYRCLDQIDDNPRCLIQGPAGTGKTLLAIEEAKKYTALGYKVGLFCYNTNLAEWLKFYFTSSTDDTKPLYVGTFHSFMINKLKNYGRTPAFPIYDDDNKEFYENELPNDLIQIVPELDDLFDVIIIDEAQDLIRENYIFVMDTYLNKGLSRGRWVLFGDFSMQAIYSSGLTGKQMIEILEEITSFIKFKLTINCRNTKRICTEIETIIQNISDIKIWNKVDGPPVQYLVWKNEEEQAKKLKELLNKLIESNVPLEQITILSPKKREDSIVSLLDEFKINNFKIPQGKKITFSTIQSYKGLENTVIILTDINTFADEKLMYVGLSRACSGLFVLESEAAKTEYEKCWIRRLSI